MTCDAEKWISFVRQYGPLARNANMYDEEIRRWSKCTGSDCLDTLLQLRPPFAWHEPDGLQGVT